MSKDCYYAKEIKNIRTTEYYIVTYFVAGVKKTNTFEFKNAVKYSIKSGRLDYIDNNRKIIHYTPYYTKQNIYKKTL